MTAESLDGVPVSPEMVVDFWVNAGPERWFKNDEAFDTEIVECFGAAADAAARGEFDDWAGTANGALALIIVLDQFRRNIHRGCVLAFSADPKALKIAEEAIARGFDKTLSVELRKWLYLPFEHSEDLGVQERGLRHFETLDDEETLKWAVIHRDIIARFGRFPHRNSILGRQTSEAEAAFLADGGFAG